MKIGIVGCAGRMGRMLVAEVLASDGCALAGGTEAPASMALGMDVAALGGGVAHDTDGAIALPAVTDDAAALFAAADVVIDFTAPAAAAAHAALAAEHATALIAGTTGLGADAEDAIAAAAQKTAIVRAANMSVGVNVLSGLVRRAAAILGDGYDIEIVEMHHRHKVDAPSGTALALGHAAAAGRGVDLDAVWERGRNGHTGARAPGGIGFAALRGGDVAGEHTVIFAADGERIELTHKATSRLVFVRGAVRAALWCDGRAPGLYSMADVLGLD